MRNGRKERYVAKSGHGVCGVPEPGLGVLPNLLRHRLQLIAIRLSKAKTLQRHIMGSSC